MDPGHDDAVALLAALAHPGCRILAVTTVAGNTAVENTCANARRIMTLAGRTGVPVAAGASRPLSGRPVTAENVHGRTGLEGANLPEPAFAAVPDFAPELIVRRLRGSSQPVTLVATAPLTNIALALLRDREAFHRVERLVIMGGAAGEGNVTPAAEFNVYADPEAAGIVLGAGLPLFMVGLDVTHQAIMTGKDIETMRGLGGDVGAAVAGLLDFYRGHYDRVYAWGGVPLHDACAVAEALCPGIVTFSPMAVEVETRGEFTRGRTVCDRWGVTGKPANAAVATGIRIGALKKFIFEALGRFPLPSPPR